MGRRLFYCDHHEIALPPGHKFPMAKYRLLREMLEADRFWEFTPAPFADIETVELAHDPEYVRRFVEGSLDAQVMRRIGFPWSEGLVRRTLASVGGTLAAARDAMDNGFGGTLAGGTHHASRDQGAGFCVFNDIAVAIMALRRDGLIERAAVVDLDVHQGDGTALIFENDPDVFTVSIHGANNFPFRKQRSRIDLELPDGTRDEYYLSSLERILRAVTDCEPQVVFYQSGVDGLEGDRLGRLSLTPKGLLRRDQMVLEFTNEKNIPVVVTLGGGYSEPPGRTATVHAGTFRTASEVFFGGRRGRKSVIAQSEECP